jgi:hypothetical protein
MIARMFISGVVRACCIGIALIVVGCGTGPKTVPATGEVSFPDRTPLTGGQVEFRSSDTSLPPARGVTGKDGKFRLAISSESDGAVPGEYRAIVIPEAPDEFGPNSHVSAQRIDPKYMDYKTSGLKFTVTDDPERNHFPIQVRRLPGS